MLYHFLHVFLMWCSSYNLGKSCFVCKFLNSELNNINGTTNSCTLCLPHFEFGLKQGSRVLEHIGAHILHDPHILHEDEPCGMCLHPLSICRIFLRHGAKGIPKIHASKSSGCGNFLTFHYSIATKSTLTSPCSNVPLPCPIFPDKVLPAVWKYNMHYHISSKHPNASLMRYVPLWELTRFETSQMLIFW